MAIITPSKEESEILGLKVARSNNMEELSCPELSAEIFEHEADIVRLKISMKDPNLFEKINQLCFPYNLFSFLIRKSASSPGIIEYRIPELTFLPYTTSRSADLKHILSDLLQNYTGTYYTTELYSGLIDNAKMNEAGICYFSSMAENDRHAHFYLGYLKNECVGVCSFRLENNIAEGVFFGVSKKQRNLGLAHEFLTYAKQKCFKMGAAEFHTDTLIQNPSSLYPQINIGLIPKQTFINVVFFPLLSKPPHMQVQLIIQHYFDLYKKTDDWLKSANINNVCLREVKTQHPFHPQLFPLEVVLKLFLLSNGTVIISIISSTQQFRAYMTGTIH